MEATVFGKKNTNYSILGPLVRLTLLLIIAQAGFAFLSFNSIFAQSPVQTFISEEALASGAVVLGICYFLAAQLFIYCLFVALTWWLAAGIGYGLRLPPKKAMTVGMLLWLVAALTLFLSNEELFPHSQFALLGGALAEAMPLFPVQHIAILALAGQAVLGIATLIALFGTLLWLIRHPFTLLILIILGAGVGMASYQYFHALKTPMRTLTKKPNVVLIGIDSLRIDQIGFFGNKGGLTPNLDQFLQEATVFPFTITPSARTFPAWISILTGNDPKLNGARYNLINDSAVDKSATLGAILQKDGYETIFATDDRRFSNIGKSYGFNKTIAPKMGFNDFLLGSFNDFPLSNVVMNTPVGRYLFPYSYGNRGVDVTYQPQTFPDWVARELEKVQHTSNKPLFLVVHLTTPHWPFVIADSATVPVASQNAATIIKEYQRAVKTADWQFDILLSSLQKTKILDNALVVALSDHGQGFGLDDDRLPKSNTYIGTQSNILPLAGQRFSTTAASVGHGTDLLSPSQFRVLLAFKTFGTPNNLAYSQSVPTSLIDIAPTVLNFVNIMPLPLMQGVSLLPALFDEKQGPAINRDLFMESSFTINSMMPVNPSVQQVLKESMNYFQIECHSGKLIMKPSIYNDVIRQKQRAVIEWPWLLTVYPPIHPETKPTLVLVNLQTGQWTLELNSPLALQAPIAHMMSTLQLLFGSEVGSF